MTRGLLLGKFMPPHAGHLHLVAVARALCDRLSIVVGTQPSEPLDGALRHRWMAELCPGCEVLHLDRELPQLPDEHPDFWRIWTDALTETLGGRPDVVFAGEAYGGPLAERLGARFVPLPRTEGLAVSGTAVRSDPAAHWDRLPGPVRAHYCRRIRVVGPESGGKTTLSRALAAALDATWVAEFARGYLEARGGALELDDMPIIAEGQAATEQALAGLGRPTLVADTDAVLTAVWSEALFGVVPPRVAAAGHHGYDVTLLVAPTDAWTPDVVRYQPDVAERRRFFERCVAAYPGAVVLEGSWKERTAAAMHAVGASAV